MNFIEGKRKTHFAEVLALHVNFPRSRKSRPRNPVFETGSQSYSLPSTDLSMMSIIVTYPASKTTRLSNMQVVVSDAVRARVGLRPRGSIARHHEVSVGDRELQYCSYTQEHIMRHFHTNSGISRNPGHQLDTLEVTRYGVEACYAMKGARSSAWEIAGRLRRNCHTTIQLLAGLPTSIHSQHNSTLLGSMCVMLTNLKRSRDSACFLRILIINPVCILTHGRIQS